MNGYQSYLRQANSGNLASGWWPARALSQISPSIGNWTAPPPYLPVYEHPHLLTCHGRMFTHTQLHGILIVMFCHVISQDSKLAIQLQAEIAIFYARRLVPRGKSTFRPRGEFIFGFFGIQR